MPKGSHVAPTTRRSGTTSAGEDVDEDEDEGGGDGIGCMRRYYR